MKRRTSWLNTAMITGMTAVLAASLSLGASAEVGFKEADTETVMETTAEEEEADSFYLTVTRNGREMKMEWDSGEISAEDVTSIDGTIHMFEITGMFERSEITWFWLSFPNYAQKGDVFYSEKDALQNGLILYTQEESFLCNRDTGAEFDSGKDYFQVEITDMYDSEDGLVIEGEFEGSFHSGDVLYEDGSFRVLAEE